MMVPRSSIGPGSSIHHVRQVAGIIPAARRSHPEPDIDDRPPRPLRRAFLDEVPFLTVFRRGRSDRCRYRHCGSRNSHWMGRNGHPILQCLAKTKRISEGRQDDIINARAAKLKSAIVRETPEEALF
jgi:hypothetical protein